MCKDVEIQAKDSQAISHVFSQVLANEVWLDL